MACSRMPEHPLPTTRRSESNLWTAAQRAGADRRLPRASAARPARGRLRAAARAARQPHRGLQVEPGAGADGGRDDAEALPRPSRLHARGPQAAAPATAAPRRGATTSTGATRAATSTSASASAIPTPIDVARAARARAATRRRHLHPRRPAPRRRTGASGLDRRLHRGQRCRDRGDLVDGADRDPDHHPRLTARLLRRAAPPTRSCRSGLLVPAEPEAAGGGIEDHVAGCRRSRARSSAPSGRNPRLPTGSRRRPRRGSRRGTPARAGSSGPSRSARRAAAPTCRGRGSRRRRSARPRAAPAPRPSSARTAFTASRWRSRIGSRLRRRSGAALRRLDEAQAASASRSGQGGERGGAWRNPSDRCSVPRLYRVSPGRSNPIRCRRRRRCPNCELRCRGHMRHNAPQTP